MIQTRGLVRVTEFVPRRLVTRRVTELMPRGLVMVMETRRLVMMRQLVGRVGMGPLMKLQGMMRNLNQIQNCLTRLPNLILTMQCHPLCLTWTSRMRLKMRFDVN